MKKINTAKKIATFSSLNSQNLSTEEIMEAINWRELSGCSFPTFNRKGLQSLVQRAMDIYEVKASEYREPGKNRGFLPWNLSGAGAPWWSLPNNKNFAVDGGVKKWVIEKHPNDSEMRKFLEKFTKKGNIVEYAARFSGWLKVAGGMEGLVKAIHDNIGNGMGSPYTTVNPFHIFDKWPSPHQAERQVWKVRERANQILEPYGLSVSWESLGKSLLKSGAVGKAALWAANNTLGHYLTYYDNREWYKEEKVDRFFYLKLARGLAKIKKYPLAIQRWAVSKCFDGEFETLCEALDVSSSRLVLDSTDGVKLYIDPTSCRKIHRVEIFTGWTSDKLTFGDPGQQSLFRQLGTGRSYHSHWNDRDGVKEAIAAWRKQAQAEKKYQEANKRLASLVDAEDRTYVVFMSDSFRAGNCRPGTLSWLQSNGLEGREVIALKDLLKYDDPRVQRVIAQVVSSIS